MSRMISKSKYLAGLQCPKLLWTHYNDKAQLPETGAATQAIFDQGHEVGRLAQSLFPGGTEVAWSDDFGAMLRSTQDMLAPRRPLYEATFGAAGVFARADILNPVEDGCWDVIEVKSSTKVKDVNLNDVAVQRYCYEAAGVPVRKCYLMHINNQYVRHGAVDAQGLLTAEDVSDTVAKILPTVAPKIAEMQQVLAQETCPVVEVGPHCDNPYSCPLKEQCWAERWEAEAAVQPANELRCDCLAVRRFMDGLVYPLHLLDFETFMTAIPRFDNSRPYRQIPFQFSLHVVETLDQPPKHHSWLWDGVGDPRSIMLAELRKVIGATGSVMAYNKTFEERCIKESAAAFPEHAEFVADLMTRMVDLANPFRSHAVYQSMQQGRWSLKVVLPAYTRKGYDDLAIGDGGTASAEFMRVMFADADPADREKVRRNLEEYCSLDTSGMLDLLRYLEGMSNRRVMEAIRMGTHRSGLESD
jgi:hypothetical protein